MGVHNDRDQPRVLCAEIIGVTWVNAAGGLCEIMANLDDASACGACLAVEDPIPVGTPVVITCHADKFPSRVRHCTPYELGWLVGVEFDADARWDQEVEVLDHRIDPRLVCGMLRARNPTKQLPDLRGTVSCIALWSALSRSTGPHR